MCVCLETEKTKSESGRDFCSLPLVPLCISAGSPCEEEERTIGEGMLKQTMTREGEVRILFSVAEALSVFFLMYIHYFVYCGYCISQLGPSGVIF